MRVVGGGAANGLAGVVDDAIEACAALLEVRAESLQGGEIAQIEAIALRAAEPARGVWLRGDDIPKRRWCLRRGMS